MGREIRRVPKDWWHPQENGYFIPMYDRSFTADAAEWERQHDLWKKGQHPDQLAHPDLCEGKYFWEEAGFPPDRKDYFPEWKEEDRTHYQMYETTSRGTPVSPVFETEEQAVDFLVRFGFGGVHGACLSRLFAETFVYDMPHLPSTPDRLNLSN